jgi:uncharacterized protein (TIGR01244 family)
MPANFTALADRFFVASQLTPADVEAAANAGFSLIVNNRPDDEEDDQPASAVLAAAAAKAGIAYVHAPVDHLGVSARHVDALSAALSRACGGKALAFCMSGKRSALAFAHLQARRGRRVADILAMTERAGFHFSHLRDALVAAGPKASPAVGFDRANIAPSAALAS